MTSTTLTTSLIGWWTPIGSPTSAASLTVNNPWVTSGTIASDCYTTDVDQCTLATTCVGNRLVYQDGSFEDCDDGFYCTAFEIFHSSPSAAPSATNFACRKQWLAHTVWVESPVYTTLTGTTDSDQDTSTADPSSSSPTSAASSTASSDSSNGTTGTATPKTGNSLSGGAIAGIVVGIVAVVALFIVGALLFRRKRGFNKVDAQPGPELPEYSTSEMPTGYHVSELPPMGHVNRGPYEAPSGGKLEEGIVGKNLPIQEHRSELE